MKRNKLPTVSELIIFTTEMEKLGYFLENLYFAAKIDHAQIQQVLGDMKVQIRQIQEKYKLL